MQVLFLAAELAEEPTAKRLGLACGIFGLLFNLKVTHEVSCTLEEDGESFDLIGSLSPVEERQFLCPAVTSGTVTSMGQCSAEQSSAGQMTRSQDASACTWR